MHFVVIAWDANDEMMHSKRVFSLYGFIENTENRKTQIATTNAIWNVRNQYFWAMVKT